MSKYRILWVEHSSGAPRRRQFETPGEARGFVLGLRASKLNHRIALRVAGEDGSYAKTPVSSLFPKPETP